jgi:hypothetical protein
MFQLKRREPDWSYKNALSTGANIDICQSLEFHTSHELSVMTTASDLYVNVPGPSASALQLPNFDGYLILNRSIHVYIMISTSIYPVSHNCSLPRLKYTDFDCGTY